MKVAKYKKNKALTGQKKKTDIEQVKWQATEENNTDMEVHEYGGLLYFTYSWYRYDKEEGRGHLKVDLNRIKKNEDDISCAERIDTLTTGIISDLYPINPANIVKFYQEYLFYFKTSPNYYDNTVDCEFRRYNLLKQDS